MPDFRAASLKRGAFFTGTSGLIAAGAFFSSLGSSAFAFAFPLLASGAGWSFGALGAAFTLYYLIRILCAPLSGVLADRFGTRALLVPAALFGAVFPLVCLVWRTPAMLAAAQCALGVSGAAIRPVSAAAVAAAGPTKSLGARFGTYNALINLAFFFGPLAAGVLFFFRDPIFVSAFLSVSMAAAALAFSLTPGAREQGVRAAASAETKRPDDVPLFWSALCAIAGRTVQAAVLAAFYPLILSRKTGGAVEASLLFAAPALAACLALPLAGRAGDGRDKTLFALAGMLIGSLALGFAGLAESPAGLLAAGLAMGAGAAISLPASMSLAATCGPQPGRVMGAGRVMRAGRVMGAGRLMGAAHAAAGVGFLVGPMLGALAAERSGRMEAALSAAACAGIMCCAPLCACVFERRLRYGRTASVFLTALALAPGLFFWPAAGPGGSVRASGAELFRQTRAAMGTLVTLTMSAPDEKTAEKAANAAFARIAALQADFDHRNPYGSVGRINLAAGKTPTAVSPEAFALIEKALFFARETDGVFDPAIGAVTTTPFYFLSPVSALRAKKALTDYRLVALDPANRTVFLRKPGMALDLGGLAKGAIMDAAANVLKENGVSAGVAEAGGDAVFFGDRTWTAGLKNPRGEGTIGSVSLKNAALCGSGDYERFVDVGGEDSGRRHHILDPRDMAPANLAAGAFALAPDAETADALATALFALGPVEGMKLLERFGPSTAALWVSSGLAVTASPGFPGVEPPLAATSPDGAPPLPPKENAAPQP